MYMNIYGFVIEKMLILVFLIIYKKKVIIRDVIYDLGLSWYFCVKVLNYFNMFKFENENEIVRLNLNIKCCVVIIFKMISYWKCLFWFN